MVPGKSRHCLFCVAVVLGTVALAARAQGDESVPGKGQDTSPVVTGRVVGSEGKPIPGVRIWGAEPQPLAITGPDGTFAIRVLQPVTPLAACPPGWLYQRRQVLGPPLPPTRGPVEFRLLPATRVSGRVVDQSGEPVAGVTVWVMREGKRGGCILEGALPPCLNGHEPRSVVTDSEGRFVFEDLEPGWFEIRVSEEGEPQVVRRRGAAGRGIEGIEFVLAQKSVPVEGRVVDADGVPVTDAAVTLSGALPSQETRTDAAGEFRFSGVLSGENHLGVNHPDHGWIEQEVEIGDRPVRLDLQMPPGTLVRGRILGPDGIPVKSVFLQDGQRYIEVAADGTFRFAVPRGEHEIMGHSFEPMATARERFTARGESVDLELRLARTGTVQVRLTGLPPSEKGSFELKERPKSFLRSSSKEDLYRIEGVPPGEWTLVASDANGRTFESPFQIGEGEMVTVEDIHFPPLSTVRGRVLDPSGKPLAGTQVTFVQDDQEIQADTVGAGIFVTWLREGSWTIRAEHKGFGLAVATVEVSGDAPVELPALRLTRLVTVSGRVLGVDPEVVVGSVRAQDENDLRQPWSEVDQDNRFSIPHLWPGTWTLSTDIDGRLVSTTLQIPPDATEVHIDLDAAAAGLAEQP